jgi:hypothetical protein
MKLNLCIETKASHEKSTRYVRVDFTEADLLEWAKQYAADHYSDTEAISVEVEAYVP